VPQRLEGDSITGLNQVSAVGEVAAQLASAEAASRDRVAAHSCKRH